MKPNSNTKERILRCRSFFPAIAYIACTFVPLYSGRAEIGSLFAVSWSDKEFEKYVYALATSCLVFWMTGLCYLMAGVNSLVSGGKGKGLPLWSRGVSVAVECAIMSIVRRAAFAPYGIDGKIVMSIVGATIICETLDIAVRFARGKTAGDRAAGITISTIYAVVATCLIPFIVWANNGKTNNDAIAYFDARIEKAVGLRDEELEEYNDASSSGKAAALVSIAMLDEEIDTLIERRNELVYIIG